MNLLCLVVDDELKSLGYLIRYIQQIPILNLVKVTDNAPAVQAFRPVLGDVPISFGSVISTQEIFYTHFYANSMWIRLNVFNNGVMATSYLAVYGYENNCGGRKSAEKIELEQNEVILYEPQPNPATNSTEVSFYIKESQQVTLSIISITGKLIKTITENTLEKGKHTYKIGKLAEGNYIINLKTIDQSQSKRIISQ